MDVELLELAENACVAPAGLSSDPQDDLSDVLRRARPAGLAGRGLGLVLLVRHLDPQYERVRLDVGHEVLDGRSERPGQPDELVALAGGHSDRPDDTSPQHLVLCLEKLDLASVFILARAGKDAAQSEVGRAWHRGSMLEPERVLLRRSSRRDGVLAPRPAFG